MAEYKLKLVNVVVTQLNQITYQNVSQRKPGFSNVNKKNGWRIFQVKPINKRNK